MCSLYHGTTVSADTSLINFSPLYPALCSQIAKRSFTNEDVLKGRFLVILSGFAHFWVPICPQNMVRPHTHTHDLSACSLLPLLPCVFFISVLLTLLVPFFLVVFFVSFLKLGPFKDAGGESFNNLLNNFFRYCIQHLLDTLLGLFTPGIS